MSQKELPKKFSKYESLLKSLANKYRLAILSYLHGHEYASVSAISENIGTSFHNTSKHLAKLEQEKIITYHEDGTYRMYKIEKKISPIASYVIGKIK